MSPLWRDEVCIDVGPRRYSLLRRRRGLQSRAVVETSGALADGRPGEWSPVLAAVHQELDRLGWRQANARVVVGDQWARYAIVPWQRELTGEEERLAHGRLILRQIYGDEMAGWSLQLGEAVNGGPRLVCALPSALLSDVQELLQRHALRPVSIRPRLVVAFNRWRSRMPDAGGWFVTVDDDCLTAVQLQGPHWTEVHNLRVGDDWTTDLNRLRTLARLAHPGEPVHRILVDAPSRLRIGGAPLRRDLEWLDADLAADAISSWHGRTQERAG